MGQPAERFTMRNKLPALTKMNQQAQMLADKHKQEKNIHQLSNRALENWFVKLEYDQANPKHMKNIRVIKDDIKHLTKRNEYSTKIIRDVDQSSSMTQSQKAQIEEALDWV